MDPPFLADRPGFAYIEGGEQGAGYYNLGRANAFPSLTAASAAKAARNATAVPVPMPARPPSTLSVQSLGQQRSVSEPPPLPAAPATTVATTLPPGETLLEGVCRAAEAAKLWRWTFYILLPPPPLPPNYVCLEPKAFETCCCCGYIQSSHPVSCHAPASRQML